MLGRQGTVASAAVAADVLGSEIGWRHLVGHWCPREGEGCRPHQIQRRSFGAPEWCPSAASIRSNGGHHVHAGR